MNIGEASYEATQQAMEGQNRHAGDSNLRVKFFMQPRQNKTKTLEAGRPIFEDREYIQILVPGNKDSVVVRPVGDIERNRFSQQYRDWKSRQESGESVVGTPLSEWPGVSRSQCEELHFFHVQTVEQLAELSDANAQGFMGIAVLRDRARAFIAASDTEKAAGELKALATENESLKSVIERLNTRLEILEEDAADKPKPRGRPKKNVEAA